MVPSVAVLLHSINSAATDIESRIAMVNTGLRHVEFDSGTHLQIPYTPSRSIDVQKFRASVDELMSHVGQTRSSTDAAMAQFQRVRDLMSRFTGKEAASERWRRNVLDVRLGYTFYGREIDQAGETKHTYRNTGTNSGGD